MRNSPRASLTQTGVGSSQGPEEDLTSAQRPLLRSEESHRSRDCHHDSRALPSLVAGRKMPLVLEDRTLHVTQDSTVPRWSSECQVVLPRHVCSMSSEWLGLWVL